MTNTDSFAPDPKLDLSFERVVDVPVEAVWEAWTVPEKLLPWFCPLPWRTTECEIDLRPGGKFRSVMMGPEGQRFDNLGCFLEVVPNERLVWTNALKPGFRPSMGPSTEGGPNFAFTAIISLARHGNGTKYSARVVHGSEADRKTHAAMGFEEGWGKALDQMVAMIKGTT
jgi:uncharacterized protein YndB with AHSA1/START domain